MKYIFKNFYFQFSFYHVGHGNQAQDIWLGRKYL